MSRTLIIAIDQTEAQLAAGFARQLGQPFDTLQLIGPASESGGKKLLLANLTTVPFAEQLAPAIAELSKSYTHIAAISSMSSKDILARVAGIMEAGMITDVVAIEPDETFVRPVFAGSVLARVKAVSSPTLITFRPATFKDSTSSAPQETTCITLDLAPTSSKQVEIRAKSGNRPDLSQAKIVVSGGRPLKDAETFERVIGGFADSLGAAVGATRAAVDSGIAPNELQVGQTGKVVAPDLYIAAGISGSTQHMAGIKDSKLIVAINKDADAPIFDQADLGIVGDLFDVLPELQNKLKS